MTKRRLMAAAIIAAVVAVFIAVFVFDPEHARWMPKCVFHQLTGWQCPGCGATRALHALLHGHPWQALQYNYFFIIGLPMLALAAYTTWGNSPFAQRLAMVVQGRTIVMAYFYLTIAWWIGRNLLGV